MDHSKGTPEAFGEKILSLLRNQFPGRRCDLEAPLRLSVDGRVLVLDNLLRMVRQNPESSEETIRNYLDRVLGAQAAAAVSLPLALARPRIMPRIQPVSMFDDLDRGQVAHVPFVNDTVVVFVLDLPDLTVTLSTEQAVRWRLAPEDLETIARQNLDAYGGEISARMVASNEGGRAAVLATRDGYDASRLLMNTLHQTLSPQLGQDFYVAAPARDVLVAMSCHPDGVVRRVLDRVERDFKTMPYPITDRLFVVTRDGVAGTARAA